MQTAAIVNATEPDGPAVHDAANEAELLRVARALRRVERKLQRIIRHRED